MPLPARLCRQTRSPAARGCCGDYARRRRISSPNCPFLLRSFSILERITSTGGSPGCPSPKFATVWSGLPPLDNSEHPDPRLRLRRLPGERRATGISPRDGGSLRTVHLDHIASEKLLVRTIGDHWAG
jgi:hypothetical protein